MRENQVKHTPGPWETKWVGQISQMGGEGICRLSPRCKHPGQRKANTSLIMAAPDLLEACYTALGVIDPVGCSQHVTELQSAIDKAEGRHEKES